MGLGAAVQQATADGQVAAADPMISQSQPVPASSLGSALSPAGSVVGGDATTRWASTWTDPSWIQIDLGTGATVNRVELDWEAAYASGFQLQVSPDAGTWT